MTPLIEIQTVPIEIKMTTKHATLEYTRGTAEMEISRSDSGGTDVRTRAIKVQMDKFEPRAGARAPRMVQNTQNQVQPGQSRQTAYAVTGTTARHGEILVNAKVGQDVLGQFGVGDVMSDVPEAFQAPAQGQQPQPQESAYEDSSGQNGDYELEDANMEIRYEMDKINFDWKLEQGEFKFTPGDIEFSVEQRPDVIIKYLGGPIYVPPSADPDYEPVDVKA